MSGETGLRERKKQRMYQNVSETAIELFLRRGFDQVSVAEVAEAAEISKPTLFRYFPAKEDLALYRFADHEDEAARVVTGREAHQSPLGALHEHFVTGLRRRDPVTGLNDDHDVLGFHDLLYGTPSLVARLHGYQHRSEEALARALAEAGPGGLEARLAAGQIITVQRILAEDNWHRIHAGSNATRLLGSAVRAANSAYGQLRDGLRPYA
ncbi:TetR/AcrR family transcriptional regulator [Streptomyces armeniacus]|uniref:TetR/AcrR family transcriptional regulator n=1 Tax=Streptomyces armeniacus TaxID=83291 RepID=A0A345XYC9_9ACTN|nr:helix-turn-helix domain-containing protein [Streptomyces armeniacus]AXK36645.1 TetR/AcrR family transcriptional regulator [Streptomyces armeniacus]